MVKGKFVVGIEGLDETANLRYEVFTGDLKMPASIEKDNYDHFAHHLIVEDGGQIAATGRLILKDDEYLIGRIAVDKAFRGKQLGDLVVRMLVDRAFSIGAEEVVVHSMTPVIGFYEKIGFKAVSEPFTEATLEHVKMVIDKEAMSHPCQGCGGC